MRFIKRAFAVHGHMQIHEPARARGPDAHRMAIMNALDLADLGSDLFDHAFGRRIEQGGDGAPAQFAADKDNDQRHQHRGNSVGLGHPG